MTSMKISELTPVISPTGLEQTVVVSNGINRRITLNAIKALVTKADLGLSLVDNTSDADKPVSTAVATALSGKSSLDHTHAIAGITDLTTVLASKANIQHGHTVSDVLGLQTTLDSKAVVNHIHGILDIPNLQAVLDTKTPVGHNHQVSEVSGLQLALDNKATLADVNALVEVVAAKALAVDVNNLQTLVASKAWTNHTHVITDTVGLQAAIDSKAVLNHTHVTADVAGLQTTIDSINTAVSSKQPLLTAGNNISILNNVISSTGSGGSSLDIIVKPVITYPLNNDINIVESSFTTAPYRNLYGYECNVVRWQIDSTAAFTSASEFILDGNSPSLIVNNIPSADQYVRVQYEDISGNVSAWSDTVKYTGAPYVLESVITDFRLKSTSIKHTGFSTVISDDGLIAVVSSPAETIEWLGETGPETIVSAGTVSIYFKTNNNWSLESKLTLPDPAAGDRFGHSVSLTADGQALVVSAPYKTGDAGAEAGVVYVYRRTLNNTAATWTQTDIIQDFGSVVPNLFGLKVLFKPDGSTIFIGLGKLDTDGCVAVFGLDGAIWSELQRIYHSEEIKPLGFGRSFALSKDGTVLAIGSRYSNPASNVAYWDPVLNNTTHSTEIGAGINSGISVTTYKVDNGYGTFYIQDGLIYLPDTGNLLPGLNYPDNTYRGHSGSVTTFGWDLSLSDDGYILAIGDPGFTPNHDDGKQGAVLFYERTRIANDFLSRYVYKSILINAVPVPLEVNYSNYGFGMKIQLQFNGKRLYVGNISRDRTTGGIYCFENIFSKWELVLSTSLQDLQLGNESALRLGCEFSISNNGDSIVVTSPGKADEEFFICKINAVRVFNPTEPHVLLSPGTNPRPDGEFGKTLSISSDGKTLAVGYVNAPGAGFSNNLENLSYESAGAIYMFEKSVVDDRWFKSKVTTTPGSQSEQFNNIHYNVITEYEQYTSDNFGKSLALSGDGKTLAVTSKSSGLLYIYSRESGSWCKTKVFTTPVSLADFGKTVCITEDGGTIAVSCSKKDTDANGNLVNMPKVAIFKKQNNVWSFTETVGPTEECLYIDEVLFTLSPTGKSLAFCYPVMTNYGETIQKLVIYSKTGNTYKLCSFLNVELITSMAIADGSVTCLNFSHNGEMLAIGNPLSNEGYGSVSLYNYEAIVPVMGITFAWQLQTVLNSSVWPNVVNFGKTLSISHDSMTLAVNSSKGIHILCNRNSGKKQRGNTKYPYSGLWQETVSNILPVGQINSVGWVLADSIQLSGNGNTLVFNDPSYIYIDSSADYTTGSVRLFGTNIYSTVTLQSGSMTYNVTQTNNATVNTLDIPIMLQASNRLEFGTDGGIDGIPGASFTGDTFIRLIDSSGNTVAFNDQNGYNDGSYLNIIIPNTGNYIMRIGAWENYTDSGTVVWKVYDF